MRKDIACKNHKHMYTLPKEKIACRNEIKNLLKVLKLIISRGFSKKDALETKGIKKEMFCEIS